MQRTDVVICEPLRTPVGNYGGVFKDVTATQLAAAVIGELVKRTGIPAESVDEVILGQCYPNGEAPAIGRIAALDAGLPITTPGIQIDRRCGSGLQAVLTAALQVQAGLTTLALAGGVESMSNAEYYSLQTRWGARSGGATLHDRLARGRVTSGGDHYPVPGGMIETAENLRSEFAISRTEQDAYAAESHRRAVAAQQSGAFKREMVPVTVHHRSSTTVVDTDECPRPGTDVETLAQLKPIMRSQDPASTVTAGNSSSQNDGAAICVVTTLENATALRLQPLARIVTSAVAGVPPRTMGIGPVPATELALSRAGLRMNDMDLVELNEAFAAQVLACTRAWNWGDKDFERLNVNGSGISLGHPVGATGTRILATMLNEMDRRGARYALETMCIGGGQGLAAIFERVVV